MNSTAEIRRQNMRAIIEEQFGGEQTRFADALGIRNPNLISRYATGKKGIGATQARKMEKVAGKPMNWLDNFHQKLSSLGDSPALISFPNTKGTEASHSFAPVLTWHEAMNPQEIMRGSSAMVQEARSGYPCPVPASPDVFVLYVHGVSMDPVLRDGDIIFVDPQVKPEHQRFVVVRIAGSPEALLRQFVVESGKQYLKTTNPAWPDAVIEIDQSVAIVGVVIFRGQAL